VIILAILARDMVGKANMQEVETVVWAVKFKILGRNLLNWHEILEQF
jgi:hypothetical protein